MHKLLNYLIYLFIAPSFFITSCSNFTKQTKKDLSIHRDVKDFAFAGPDEFKYDTSIDIFTQYKKYIASKPWVKDNYLRIPDRKPNWVS